MKRKLLLYLGLATPTITEIREKYKFPAELIQQKKRAIGLERHLEKVL